MAHLPLYDGLEMPSRYGWMADTDPKAFQALIEIRRNMTFDERFRQFLEMTEMVLRGYEDRVRREYPQASEYLGVADLLEQALAEGPEPH